MSLESENKFYTSVSDRLGRIEGLVSIILEKEKIAQANREDVLQRLTRTEQNVENISRLIPSVSKNREESIRIVAESEAHKKDNMADRAKIAIGVSIAAVLVSLANAASSLYRNIMM